jgi:hypothetical protein
MVGSAEGERSIGSPSGGEIGVHVQDAGSDDSCVRRCQHVIEQLGVAAEDVGVAVGRIQRPQGIGEGRASQQRLHRGR